MASAQKNESRSGGDGDSQSTVINQKILATLTRLISNAALPRARLARAMMDPRRDINDECGYPRTEDLTPEVYRDMYDREAVAARVVEVLPCECWQTQPSVYETEDASEATAFEEAWKTLGQSLRGSSWFQDETGSPIWEYLCQIDKRSGIGQFGVLLLGFDDGKSLNGPVDGINDRGEWVGGKRKRKLLYLRAFDQSLVGITRSENDVNNPRYGQPVEYNIKLGVTGKTQTVHWSRVIHVADDLVLGTPRMQPVYNHLYNLQKIYGSDAEAYWYNVVGDLFFQAADPATAGELEVDQAELRAMMEKMKSGLQRWAYIRELTANRVVPTVVDPTSHVDVQITAICIKIAVPKRVFMGSERGELASSQDDSAWNDRLRDRQNGYITPRIIVPFIDRLIATGVLPEPKGFSVVWPDLDTLTEDEQATVAAKRTEAMAKYVQGNVEAIMLPLDFYTRILKLTQEEAEAVLEAVLEEMPDDEDDEEDEDGKKEVIERDEEEEEESC